MYMKYGHTWNAENKMVLLEAELHYLNNRIEMADLSYQVSIASAQDHQFIREGEI